jgi:hypothetical protein
MTIRINPGAALGPPSTRGMLGKLYENLAADPPQAAEPMGNSIRRLLNATQGNQPGWTKLPMQQFSDAETAGPPDQQTAMGSAGQPWGRATPAASPAGGPGSAWTEGLPGPMSARPSRAVQAELDRQAVDRLKVAYHAEQLRRRFQQYGR